jgi:hypothetical protein
VGVLAVTWGGAWQAYIIDANQRVPVMHAPALSAYRPVTVCGRRLFPLDGGRVDYTRPLFCARLPVGHALAFCRPCRRCQAWAGPPE